MKFLLHSGISKMVHFSLLMTVELTIVIEFLCLQRNLAWII